MAGLTTEPCRSARPTSGRCCRDCGAVVLFSGTVRDHAVDEHGGLRDGVEPPDLRGVREQVVPAVRGDRRRAAPALAGNRPRRAVPPHRRAGARRESPSSPWSAPAPSRGVRGRPLRDRRAEGCRRRSGSTRCGRTAPIGALAPVRPSMPQSVPTLVGSAARVVIGSSSSSSLLCCCSPSWSSPTSRRPRQDAGIISFRRHIDALSPESRREVMDRVRPTQQRPDADARRRRDRSRRTSPWPATSPSTSAPPTRSCT